MTVTTPGLLATSQVLAHVPDLVFSGSKPMREIQRDPSIATGIGQALRSIDEAIDYPPNRIFIGATPPHALLQESPQRHQVEANAENRSGDFGVLFTQDEFFAALGAVDSAGLVSLAEQPRIDAKSVGGAIVESLVVEGSPVEAGDPTPLLGRDGELGTVSWGYPNDDALSPSVVLENLATKATASLALAHLLGSHDIEPESIDFVISCSEEAIGDRYQRGGGNLGKAVAEAVGARRSSGFDVKNFCAAPVPALVVASSLIASGVARRIAVVAGGSVPKLGMKFQGHLGAGMPVLEDCLGGVAALLCAESDGPRIRLDAVGRHTVGAGGSNQQIFSELVFDPLESIDLRASDVDLFGTELHNPELTEPQGSGNVPLRNYKMIAALAARRGHIEAAAIDQFLSTRCVAGFAPTQGHIASAICLLPHVRREIAAGRIDRAMLIAKGSLFLGRMSSLSDGMSIVVEA